MEYNFNLRQGFSLRTGIYNAKKSNILPLENFSVYGTVDKSVNPPKQIRTIHNFVLLNCEATFDYLL